MKKIFNVILCFIFIFSLLSLIGCDEQQGNVDQHKHNYIDQVVNSTCTAQGYTLHTCSCGNSYKDNYVSAKGHSYETQVVKPTCTEQGYTLHKCSICNNSFKDDYVSAKGHSYVTQVVKPTCTEQGYTLHKCSICNNSFKDNFVNAKGHCYTSKITKEATVYETGLKTYTCQNCGDMYNEIIPKLKSDWTIVELVDDFGYKTGKIELLGVFDATYQRSGSLDEYNCSVVITMFLNSTDTSVLIDVYEYNKKIDMIKSSPSTYFTGTNPNYFITNNKNNEREYFGMFFNLLKGYTKDDDIFEMNGLFIKNIKNNEELDCVMYLSGNKTMYKFAMNNAGFSELYSVLEESRV